jgi:hypothetical protein
VVIEFTATISDLTAAKVSDTSFVVCYGMSGTTLGTCRAAVVSAAGIVFGSAVTLPDSTTYLTGSLTGLVDATDRAVLCFATGGALPASKMIVLGVSSTSLTPLTSGTLDRFEVSAAADFISVVALTRFNLLLTYRVSTLD